MLLSAHAARELHAYSEVHTAIENSSLDNCNECLDVKTVSSANNVYGRNCQAEHTSLNDDDSCSITSDDDLDQDHEVWTMLTFHR